MSRHTKKYDCKWCHTDEDILFYGADKTLCKKCKITIQKIKNNKISDLDSIKLLNLGYQITSKEKNNIGTSELTSVINDLKTQNKLILDKISNNDIFITPLTTENIRNSGLNDANSFESFDTDILLKEIEQIKKDKNFLQIDNELKSEEIENLYKETDDLQLSLDTLKQENDILKNTNFELTNQIDKLLPEYDTCIQRNIFLESEYLKFQQCYQEYLNNQLEHQNFKKQFDFYKSVCPKNKLKDVPK
jgi:hypothetical protein